MNERPPSHPRTTPPGARRPREGRPVARRDAVRRREGAEPRDRGQASPELAKWVPVGAAGALLVAVIGAGVLSAAGGGSEAADSTTVVTGSSVTTAASAPVAAPTTNQVVLTPTSAPIQKVPLDRSLTNGLAGDDVERVQNRLIELGFDPGPADGIYGTMTIQSVWAFEKLLLGVPREQATGTVTPEMWDRMQDPITVQPRRPQPAGVNHVEIYLPEQVMVVFHDDVPRLITHISSGELDENGEPAQYCETIRVDTGPDGTPLPEPVEKPICGIAKTPGGIFDVDRFVPGTRVGPLGAMWNPIYFNYGIAIHGARNVPLEPASHGCIRIPMHISEYTQELIKPGDNVWVWNGLKEPEQQTREDELPVFDWLDTSRTTTTTSTTTTTTSVAPTTTVPAPTTTAAVTTVATTTTPPDTTTTTTVVPSGDGG